VRVPVPANASMYALRKGSAADHPWSTPLLDPVHFRGHTHVVSPRPSFKLSRRSFAGLLLLGALPATASATNAPYQARSLTTDRGATTSLAEIAAGNTLVVVVMKGHYCPVCRGQLARLEAMQGEFARAGARLTALNADPPAANRAIAEKFGFTSPITSDQGRSVLGALGLWLADAGHPLPAVVVFDACGTEVQRIVGRSDDARPESTLLETARKLHAKPPSCSVA
jgi:peroxiredoxin